MLNFYFTYTLNNKAVVDAIAVPSMPGLTFSAVKSGLIVPHLEAKGVKGYSGLTYARAKSASGITPTPAASITPTLNVNGVNYNTATGAAIAAAPAEAPKKAAAK